MSEGWERKEYCCFYGEVLEKYGWFWDWDCYLGYFWRIGDRR